MPGISRSANLILIVEDEAILRMSLADDLRQSGYDVDEAGNGRVALACMRRRVPHLVLLDLRMPIMDGFSFRAEQRQDPLLASVPVILISANGEEENARSLGAAGVLDKPVQFPKLIAMINSLHRANGVETT